MRVALVVSGLLLLSGCTEDRTPVIVDPLPPDPTPTPVPTGPPTVTLSGPNLAFTDRPTCFEAQLNFPRGGELSWFFEPEGAIGVLDSSAPNDRRRRCHRFETPGEHGAFVTFTVGERSATASLRVLVVRPQTDPAPEHASPIIYDAAKERIWVVNPDADSVSVIEMSQEPREVIEIQTCAQPRTLAQRGRFVIVACQGDGVLARYDADELAELEPVTFEAGSGPYGVSPIPGTMDVLVSLQRAGRVVRVVAHNGSLDNLVDVGPDPRGIAVNAGGVALVTRWRSDAEGARLYQLDVRGDTGLTLIGEVLLPKQEGLDSELDNSGVPSFLNQAVFEPSGQRAMVPALKANVVTGEFLNGESLRFDTTARATVRELIVGIPELLAVPGFPMSFDDTDYASAAVYAPEGHRLYVAMQGSEAVSVVDVFAHTTVGSVDTFVEGSLGSAPQGLVLSPDGQTLYVQAFLARSVRIYDVSDLSVAPSLQEEISTVSNEPLDPEVLLGKRLFYAARDPRMSRNDYLSCASCHLDGEGDNLVWDFTQRGEGLRNTISLLGRAGVAPLHWSANFDEVQDFEHDIRGPQAGLGYLEDADFHDGRDTPMGEPKAGVSAALDALAAYVESLSTVGISPTRQEDPEWVSQVSRGQALFESDAVGCADCHPAPRYSDSAFGDDGAPILHDVGTLSAGSGGRLGDSLPGIDTPELRGLFATAPYLHDGSAATLRDVLTTRNPDDRHGRTSQLSLDELADLEAFLLSLDDRAP